MLISLLVTAAVYALVLSLIPWVEHKGYGSCFAVALIMALVRMLLVVFALPLLVGLAIFSAIPVIGWILGPLLITLLCWMVNTVALYLADQAIEDFKIDTLAHTALTALVTGIASGFLLKLFNL